jgi:putative pyruvate formate lyase activating enzyme
MTGAGQITTTARRLRRDDLARSRVRVARASLSECRLCAHDCGVNRLRGDRGVCRAGADTRVFLAQVEVSDEIELIPTYAIALSGCDMRCAFCITGAESWNPGAGERLDPEAIAARARVALEEGARTVMILGGEPTIHLPSVLEIVAALPNDARLVWKTNAHGSAQARDLLEDLFDVWLADYKFGNDGCARRLAGITGYTDVVRENLLWAHDHSELVVRHLVMPGHVDCCWAPAAQWLAARLPGVKVNLRSGFWPAWQAGRHPELRGTATDAEGARARELGRELELCLVD